VHTPASAGDPLVLVGQRARCGVVEVVVADDRGLGPELLEVADEGVDEAVVVVDDEDLDGHGVSWERGASRRGRPPSLPAARAARTGLAH
jgi:hypothetical protein